MPGQEARRIRMRLWGDQGGKCHWCAKITVLPERLFAEYLPMDDIYSKGYADRIPILHAQLMAKVPEFRDRWNNDLATLDHVIEHARGGSDDESNLVVACAPCNAERGLKFQELFVSDPDLLLDSADAAESIPVIVPSGSGWFLI